MWHKLALLAGIAVVFCFLFLGTSLMFLRASPLCLELAFRWPLIFEALGKGQTQPFCRYHQRLHQCSNDGIVVIGLGRFERASSEIKANRDFAFGIWH